MEREPGKRSADPARSVERARGQASVELVALLPLVVALAAGLWQVALAGQAAWAASAAARAGARAQAVGADERRAALRVVPAHLRRGARVEARGGIAVRIPVRAVVGGAVLWTASGRARFEEQR